MRNSAIKIACKAHELPSCLAEVGPALDGMIAAALVRRLEIDLEATRELVNAGRGEDALARITGSLHDSLESVRGAA